MGARRMGGTVGARGASVRGVAKDAFGAPVIRVVDGHEVRVSNPDKPYFPDAAGRAITKLEVIDYYTAVGQVMLTALRDRPTTLERWPGGVVPGARLSTREGFKGEAFYQKRVPSGAPDWVRTARIAFPSGRRSSGRHSWARSPSTRGRSARGTSSIPMSCASTSIPSPGRTSTTR